MFAARGLEAQFYERLNVYLMTGLALLAIFLLVWLTLRVRIYFFESDDSDEPVSEMLAQFRQLKRQGELTEEEYRLISQRLSGTPMATKSAVLTGPPSPVDSPQPEESADPPPN